MSPISAYYQTATNHIGPVTYQQAGNATQSVTSTGQIAFPEEVTYPSLRINYNSKLGSYSGQVSHFVFFDPETHEIITNSDKVLITTDECKEELANSASGDAGASFDAGEHNTFKGWSTSATSPSDPLLPSGTSITYDMWTNGTAGEEDNQRVLNLYAVWESDETGLGDLTGTCYIDNEVYSGFDFEKYDYEFTEPATGSASHTVKFDGISATWKLEMTNGTENVTEDGTEITVPWIKATFTKDDTTKTYTFKWKPNVSETSLKDALSSATLVVKNKDGDIAAVTPAFSYDTTAYTVQGTSVDLSGGAQIGFNSIGAGVSLSSGTPTTSEAEGQVTVTFPFTVSKGDESKDYTLTYSYPKATPSYDELSNLTATVDGSPYEDFSPDKLTYTFESTPGTHSAGLGNVPAGWTVEKDSSTDGGVLKFTFTLKNGNLSKTYTFQWGDSENPTEPSFDELKNMKATVDDKDYEDFSYQTTTYNLADGADGHSVGISNYPTDWEVKKNSEINDGVAKITFTFKKDSLERVYTFQWKTTSSSPSTEPSFEELKDMKAAVDDKDYEDFSYQMTTYNLPDGSDGHSVAISDYPADWNVTKNSETNDGVSKITFTFKKGSLERVYTFQWKSSSSSPSTEPSTNPSFEELKDMKATVDNKGYDSFSYQTTTYNLSDGADGHTVAISGYPAGWDVTKGNETEDGVAKHTFTFKKGDLTRTYTFQWKTTSSSPSTEPSFDELKNMKATVDDKNYDSFSYQTTTYNLPDGEDGHNVTISGYPSGWVASKSSDVTDGVAKIAFTLTKGNLTRTYTFQWKSSSSSPSTPSTDPSVDELKSLKASVDGKSYDNFSYQTTTYNLSDGNEGHSVVLNDIPSGWESDSKDSSDPISGTSNVQFTLTKGNLTRTYTFQWKTSAKTPSLNDLAVLKATIDGKELPDFVPTKTSYEIAVSPIEHPVQLVNVPDGWSVRFTMVGMSKQILTISNGTLSRTYSFTFNEESTPSNPDNGNGGNNGESNGNGTQPANSGNQSDGQAGNGATSTNQGSNGSQNNTGSSSSNATNVRSTSTTSPSVSASTQDSSQQKNLVSTGSSIIGALATLLASLVGMAVMSHMRKRNQ